MLHRIDAEGVFHLERSKRSGRSVRFDEEFVAGPEEARARALIIEDGIIEIATHGLRAGMSHRALVLRRAPQPRFGGMAVGAFLAADKAGARCLQRAAGIAVTAQEQSTPNQQE
ncbi:hypothetical protein [Bradyrhizobium sp. AUGA SZCCT0283]|uniref:hypothetical protein n=1 Tax=Bradyrhizobium sp. AUGA SZCCT0283 TaxID=2807671 RepID=UPI0028A0DCDC|nr:hypothetical protein [Bradyrhizobium sp. AUGA SZCCT0283]